MPTYFKSWFFALVLLLGLWVMSGCQSCQDSDVPPPPVPAEEGVAPAAPATGVAEPGVEGAAGEDEVDEDALVLLAEGDPEDGDAPLTVRFTVESLIEDEMNKPQYKWDFGDGSPVSTEANPTHIYAEPGSYTATIRIVDAAGQQGWDEVDIEVDKP